MSKSILFVFLLFSVCSLAQTTSFPGNGRSSFGGPIGQGSVSITDNGPSLTFTLTRGPGSLNDLVVFYVDITSGGISNTRGLTSVANKYEIAVSTKRGNGIDSSILNFPATFQPDAALTFDKDGGKTFFFPPAGFGPSMVEGNAPNVTPTGNANAPTYSQTINKSDLNLGSGAVTFKFLGTYISGTAFRSDEAFGDAINGYRVATPLQPNGNVGWNPVTITTFFTYSSTTLPVKLVDFKAMKERETVQLQWAVADETNIEEYQVQRSVNGVQFNTISVVKGKNAPGSTMYAFADKEAQKGINYYRLSVVERGKFEYSKVVSIRNTTDKNSFTVLPRGRTLMLKLSGIDAGIYKVSVMNTSGQLLHVASFQHDGSEILKDIELKDGLSRGVYRVTLQGENAQFIKSILVQ